MKNGPKPGDLVLATKYSDGDPQDHWVVGFYDCECLGRHLVMDHNGNQMRANGFRRVGALHELAGIGCWIE